MFKIYDITNIGAAYFLRWLEKTIDGATKFHPVANEFKHEDVEIEPVENGLSPGETRQSLLDRYRNDFKRGKQKESVTHLEGILDEMQKNDNTIPKESPTNNENNEYTTATQIIDSAESETLTLKDVDNFLYSLEDHELVGMWVFADKLIYVRNT